jgi:SAM-dependent methyltransferase
MNFQGQQESSMIRAWANDGVHDRVMAIANHSVPLGGRVLDIACGPGALSARLDGEGFSVIAADAFPEVFRLHGRIPFMELDVEREWSCIEVGFDAVCAVEIIEHVENPYLFARRCFEALKPGGVLIMTTPNAGHYVSRITFLLSGVFELYSPRSFRPKTRTEKGTILPPHINLFTGWMIKGNLERAGFQDIVFSSCNGWLTGLLPIPRRPLNLLRWGVHRLLGTFASGVMRSPAKDSVFSKNIVAVARKPGITTAEDNEA